MPSKKESTMWLKTELNAATIALADARAHNADMKEHQHVSPHMGIEVGVVHSHVSLLWNGK